MKGTLMLDVSQADRRTGRDWPYTEQQMQQKSSLETCAQQDYPVAGRPAARRHGA